MDKCEINLKIPKGYKIVERTENMDLYSACDKLRSRKQKYITSAKRTGNSAMLTGHRIKCPHCGGEFPAYVHCWSKYSEAFPKKSETEIANWAGIQLSMMEAPDEILSVQVAGAYSGEYICEKCGYNSEESDEDMDLFIEYNEDKLNVKRVIKNLVELVSMKWLTGAENINFPLYEQIVFDFGSSVTYLQLVSKEQVVCTTVVTNSDIDLEKDVLVDLFQKNTILKRTVKRLFESITGCKIPFATKELDFCKYVNFLSFRGFPKDFYDAIPYWEGTKVIDDSFAELTKKLNTPEGAMKVLEESSIPFCKSVKRLFAQRSGLFFYLKECEFLFALFNDVNLFCSCLNNEFTFYFLSMIHYYESSIKTFLTDYSRVMGKERFAHKNLCSDIVVDYAIHYSSLSEYVQKKEQEKWLQGIDVFDDFSILVHRVNNISVPMPLVSSDVRDCLLDEYRFKYLKTKHECVVAGKKLKNCLVNWSPYSNPVVVIYRADKMIAAIEVFNNTVLQARARENKSISTGSDLYNLIEKWCKKNKIEWVPGEIDGPFIR